MVRLMSCLVLLGLAACGSSTATPPVPAVTRTPASLAVEGKTYRVTGPTVHENLAVYVLHADERDDRDFITLDEGLKAGTVTVTEKSAEGQVSELLLENRSDTALFIQEGDRVQGGKQDRIIGLSFVVPPKSGKMPVPSFCIEQGRWSGGAVGKLEGASFRGAESKQLAPKQVREAAKAGKDQGEVWREVGGMKRKAEQTLGAENSNTSLNETMDSAKSRKAIEPFETHLGAVLVGKPDAVGVAFAVNGRIEEINIYPGRRLLSKLYPRLLGSYALAAVMDRKEASAPSAADVAAFMKESREKNKRTEQVAGNTVTVRDLEANVHCITEYDGKAVHSQWMSRSERSAKDEDNEPRQRVEQDQQQERR